MPGQTTEDPQYPLSMACLGYLEGETDAKGKKITVHKLRSPDQEDDPDHPVCVTREELEGYVFEDGEDVLLGRGRNVWQLLM